MKLIATRDGFGDEIVELGKENKNIYVIDADIGKSCKTGKFVKALPEQHVNVGIAEQCAGGVAAGLPRGWHPRRGPRPPPWPFRVRRSSLRSASAATRSQSL